MSAANHEKQESVPIEEAPAPPEMIDELDKLRITNVELRNQLWQQESKHVDEILAMKYSLRPGDKVASTGEIIRRKNIGQEMLTAMASANGKS